MRPDSRAKLTGRKADTGAHMDFATLRRLQDRADLQDLERTAMGETTRPAMRAPHDYWESAKDAARSLGLDANRTRVAAHLIGQVAADARDLMGIAKSAAEAGLDQGVTSEIIRRGMLLYGDRKRGLVKSDDMTKAGGGPYIGPKGGKWADPDFTIPWKEGAGGAKPKAGKPKPKPAQAEGAPKDDRGDVHARYKEIATRAKKHGVKLSGKFDPQHHTHEHLDALERKIGAHLSKKFGGGSAPAPGSPSAVSAPAASGPGSESPPQAAGGTPQSQQGDAQAKPQGGPADFRAIDPSAYMGHTKPVSVHEKQALVQQTHDHESTLDKLKERLSSPHQEGMYKELKGDAAKVRKNPSREAVAWLGHRVASFAGLVLGMAAGAALAGPGGVLAGGALGYMATKSEAVLDRRTGRLYFRKAHVDQIAGGLADKKQPRDFDRDALAEGIAVELEHTKDPRVAREIAMDHLTEDAQYYTKLRAIEKKSETAPKVAAIPEVEPTEPTTTEPDEQGEAEPAPKSDVPVGAVQTLMKKAGVVVRRGGRGIVLQGDLRKAGVPDYMLEHAHNPFQTSIDADAARDLLKFLGGADARQDRQ